MEGQFGEQPLLGQQTLGEAQCFCVRVHVGYLTSRSLGSSNTATYIINSMIFPLLVINLLRFPTILHSFDKLFV